MDAAVLDHDTCYRAVRSKDARFDGRFVTAVRTTGIYCRPSCPALTPRSHNVEFFATAATAHDRGYRACKRCRPDASPGSPDWDVRGDAVARAMRLVHDGVVDREGVSGLAARLHYSERHLSRLLTDELGSGPLAIARAQRAQVARTLIETTSLPFTSIAYAAGFGSIRQFNDTVRAVYDATPSALRERSGRATDEDGSGPSPDATVTVELAVREPFDLSSTLAFLASRALPGVEVVGDDGYRRVLDLPHGHGLVRVQPSPVRDGRRVVVRAELALVDWRDLGPAVQRLRRLLDLDADPIAVSEVLEATPGPVAAAVAANPGRRVPGSVEPFETVIRAVVGQQVSVAAARTVVGKIVAECGAPLDARVAADPLAAGLTHAFPAAAAVGAIDPSRLAMPVSRRTTVREVSARVASGDVPLDIGADRADVRRTLLAVAGIGPWTADYVLMRGLSDPDVFLPTDLGVVRSLRAAGLDPAIADSWRPWRSYALHHLWALPTPPDRPAPRG